MIGNVFILAVFCLVSCVDASEAKTIDLHEKSISLSTIGQVGSSLRELPKTSKYKVDLSDNYIDDCSLEMLISIIDEEDLAPHIEVLDLTNNRVTLRGLQRIFPLIIRDTFKWLVVPINCLDVSDMRALTTNLKEKAGDIAPAKGIASEDLLNKWLEKIIWLPKTFDFSALLPTEQSTAHTRYYRK